MQLEFIAAAQLSEKDAAALEALHAAVYPPKPGATKAEPQQAWAEPQWHILIRDEADQLVSHVGAVTRICLCDSVEILIGGIGGVMTHPAQRGKGYAGAGVRRALDFLRQEMRVEFALLFCAPRMRSYYRRFGFSSFVGDTRARRGDSEVIFPRNEVMAIAALKPLPQCALLDLCGLPW